MARTPLMRRVQVLIDNTLSPQALSARLAETAKRVRDREIKSGAVPPIYRTFVDGREGASEESVKPSGKIVYRFNSMGVVGRYALSFLINRSPPRSSAPLNPKTGKTAHYRDGFMIGVNGRLIPEKSFDMKSVPADAELVITNFLPYHRKVDVQLVGGRKLNFGTNSPAGLLDDAVVSIKKRFDDLVDVKRVYTMKFSGQYILRQEQTHKSGKYAGRPRKRAGKPVESPAIIITPRK